MRLGWKLLLFLAAAAGLGTWVMADHHSRLRVGELWRQLFTASAHAGESQSSKDWIGKLSEVGNGSPKPVLALTADQVRGIGLKTVVVLAQSQPIILRLQGTTEYDQFTLRTVRPQFDCRVDRVIVDLGSVVKKGDPLLELFSNDLADAKSAYESARSQHSRDEKMLNARGPLAERGNIPGKEKIEMENDEAKSRLQMKLAKDKLLVFGLTEKEIEDAANEDGVQKAKMILRSAADGIVIKRSAVQGNYYDNKDELMEIAPLEHLKVWVTVSELDADKVELGQKIRIIFPFADQEVEAQVEYIDKAIDPETRAARFRATISNPEKRFKARAFVRVLLEIPPKPGRTVIPRGAMVSVDRLDFVFVKRKDAPGQFERRNVLVNKESSDSVIVEEPSKDHIGLRPGEEVVTNGSLILEQMFEDRLTLQGEIPSERPRDDEVFGHSDRPTFVTTH
jgi:cobalt-zinc-cadmium efflux system membrane fusion protein